MTQDVRLPFLPLWLLSCLWKRFYLPRANWITIRQLVDDADVIHLMGHWGALNALSIWRSAVRTSPGVVPGRCSAIVWSLLNPQADV